MPYATFDANYEFNAPRFWDFTQKDDSGADAFFDQELSQPSPAKKAHPQQNAVPAANLVFVERTPSPMRPPAVVRENKTAAKKASLYKKPPQSVQPQKTWAVPATPTAGVKKCKPKSPTKTMAIAFKTGRRTIAPMVRGRSEALSGLKDYVSETTKDVKPSANGTKNPSSISTVARTESVTSVKTVSSSHDDRKYHTYGLQRSLSQGPFIEKAAVVSNGHPSSAYYTTPNSVTKSKSISNVASIGTKITSNVQTPVARRRSYSTEQLSKHQPIFSCPKPPVSALLKCRQNSVEVQPFRLRTEERDAKFREKWRMKLEKEEAERRNKALFHARPMPDFKAITASAKKRQKLATEPQAFDLYTARRAEKRRVFDTALKEKRDEMKKEMAKKEQERQVREELETKQLRRTLVHHAQPIPQHKPFQVKRGIVAKTVPEAPKFLTDQRLKDRVARPPQNDWSSKL